MPEIEEVPGQPDALYPTMKLLVELGKLLAPFSQHTVIRLRAEELQANGGRGFDAEAKMMRVLQNGINFGKWS
jgi:hypothetical protein